MVAVGPENTAIRGLSASFTGAPVASVAPPNQRDGRTSRDNPGIRRLKRRAREMVVTAALKGIGDP